jgi:hypothetical protein
MDVCSQKPHSETVTLGTLAAILEIFLTASVARPLEYKGSDPEGGPSVASATVNGQPPATRDPQLITTGYAVRATKDQPG